jgi:Fe-S cluster biosynthesis and repair protein YggX
MPTLTCTRCGLTRDQQVFQPFPTDIGRRVFQEICAVCWAEWLKYQQQLINHYALNLREPQAKEFLLQHMEQFLFTNAPQA